MHVSTGIKENNMSSVGHILSMMGQKWSQGVHTCINQNINLNKPLLSHLGCKTAQAWISKQVLIPLVK